SVVVFTCQLYASFSSILFTHPPRSTLFPTRRSSDLLRQKLFIDQFRTGGGQRFGIGRCENVALAEQRQTHLLRLFAHVLQKFLLDQQHHAFYVEISGEQCEKFWKLHIR